MKRVQLVKKDDAKAYGDLARSDIAHHHSKMKRDKGESIEDFANRMYCMQMEIYSAYAGRDLHTDFNMLPAPIRNQWIKTATELEAKRGKA